MWTSKTIRIDPEVWAELQKLATPLEDTPNSVMRRLLRLPERGSEPDEVDPRVTELLEVVEKLAGQKPQVKLGEQGYSVQSAAGDIIAYIHSGEGHLRIVASKRLAEKAGLRDWDNELKKSKTFGGSSVRWYLPHGNASASRRIAAVLAMLWKGNVSAGAVALNPEATSRS